MFLLNATPNEVHPNSFSPNVQESGLIDSLPSIIRRPIHYPFRRLEIKRRSSTTGLYENDWLDITDYVVKWGNIQLSIDDLRINQYVFSGLNVTVKNDYGEFNPEYDGQSLFYGYLTRYRTLVRLSAGYTNGSGTQFPTDARQGLFVMDANIDISPSQKEVRLICKSIISPFQDTNAEDIDGIVSPITASQIIEKIRDATDGSGHYLFQYFVSASAWYIQPTTTPIVNFDTTSALEGISVWELMQQLAEAENFIVTPTRYGGLEFRDRRPNSVDSSWSFYGQGNKDPDIISIKQYKEATEKLYTGIRFKWQAPETESSYITVGTVTTVDIRSNEWKYGQRIYEYENSFYSNEVNALESANKIIGEFGSLRNEMTVDVLFNPVIELGDRVEVSYHEYKTPVDANYLWDARDWASDTITSDGNNILFWAPETTSAIDMYGKGFKVLSKSTNLDNYVTTLILREV